MSTKPLDEEALFHAARQIAAGEARDLFLQQACGDNAALAARVHALIDMHEREPESDEALPERTGDYETIVEQPGSRIGPYLLREKIGEGGFGLVFVAEQTEPVRRKVALKIIKPGMDSRQVVARFQAEQQALALMDHPNIARVLDAGATDSGRPYFVMELVRGIPITDYCDKNQLPPKERLELFITVCQAIQHAHQKGIIHRDIKPSNVLVTSHDGKPVAKVIDFGIAKAMYQQLTERSIYTNFAQMIGTPLYMSPEQAEMTGLDIDTRADIYSLGVLLYELLTGSTPIERKRFAKAAYDEIRRLIREEEPPKPSTRLSASESAPSVAAQRHMEPARLSKLVRGDLDWITMKCLEKDRTRRYETASGLARDIQRYLSDEPVEASPPSARYRLRKFAKKNRAILSTATAFAVLLVAGSGVAAWLAVWATQAERSARAAQAAEAARADSEAQAKQEAITQGQAAERAAAAEKTAKELAEKQRREAETNLGYARKGNDLLGSVFSGLDPKANYATVGEFRAVLKKNLAKAVKELDGSAIGDPLTVAGMQNTLGLSLLGLGEANQAIIVFEKARATRASRLGADHPDTLTTMSNLAKAYYSAGKLDRALPLYEETLKLEKAKPGADHPSTLITMNNLASAYLAAGKLDRALPLYEEALKLMKAKLGAEHPHTLTTMSNLVTAYQYTGKRDLALPLLEETLKLRKAKLGAEHPYTLRGMNNLAVAYQDAGKLDQALPLYQQAAAGMEKLRFQHLYAGRSVGNLIACHEQLKQFDQAEKWRRKWLAVVKQRAGADSIAYASELAALGLNLIHQKKWPEVETTLTQYLAIRRKKQPDVWNTFNTQSSLGAALLGQKKYAEAEPLLLAGYEGMKKREKTIPPVVRDIRLREAVERLVQLYDALGKKDDAAKWRKELANYPKTTPMPKKK